jgi:hypothetical protein
VQPTDAERVLNGKRTEYRLHRHRQIEKAIEAFGQNGFLVLIDDKQTETSTRSSRLATEGR